ncbi:MAG: VOC family protein [Fimbriimonadaceae bacterium]|nr:VOC family protein [Chitinophagales bacterium]
MATANVYLNFNGNCEEAFNFYQTVFGGDFGYIGRFKDMPAGEGGTKMSPEDGEKIMHISIRLSETSAIMGSDTGGEWAPNFKQGNNFSVSLTTESKDEADKLYNGLSNGGQATMPMAKTFWGDYFGMFTDKFGINWMVSYNENPQK